jgi:hypothetical protein
MLQEEQENRLKDRKRKEYQSQESQICTAKEPEVLYEAKSDTQTFDEEFDKALATALTPDEFLQAMYKAIEALPWKKR